jgi:uracil-DNA glycosylase
MTHVALEATWKSVLTPEFEKPYFAALVEFVKKECAQHQVFPPGKLIFRALDATPIDRVKAVILGQDPYHGPGQANGLCFSVNDGVPIPPSLQNIFKEIASDLGTPMPTQGNLERWAAQGVLLLNATLTVRAHSPGSHQNRGWETFTDAVIRLVSEHCNQVVFLLWGSYAQRKASLIDPEKHLILQSVHPSPLSAHRGFFGCRHFSKANAYLVEKGKQLIHW